MLQRLLLQIDYISLYSIEWHGVKKNIFYYRFYYLPVAPCKPTGDAVRHSYDLSDIAKFMLVEKQVFLHFFHCFPEIFVVDLPTVGRVSRLGIEVVDSPLSLYHRFRVIPYLASPIPAIIVFIAPSLCICFKGFRVEILYLLRNARAHNILTVARMCDVIYPHIFVGVSFTMSWEV